MSFALLELSLINSAVSVIYAAYAPFFTVTELTLIIELVLA